MSTGKAIAGAVVAFIVGVGVGMQAAEDPGGSASLVAPDATTSPLEEPEPTEEPTPEPEPPAEPEGKFGLASCDLQLSLEGASTLVGSTEVENTGEVTAHLVVKFRWQLGDGSWVNAKPKEVSLAKGASRLVFFKATVTTDQVSLFQSHPGYTDSSNCKTNATIT
jgi:hypothetical protein